MYSIIIRTDKNTINNTITIAALLLLTINTANGDSDSTTPLITRLSTTITLLHSYDIIDEYGK